jgi:hypothetical protein
MQSQLSDALRQAAVATFEQLVFLLPDTPPDEQQRAVPVTAIASITFAGPRRGVLQVRACEGLLPRLVSSMLGDDGASEALQLDALGEIANIICGQVFPFLDTIRAFEQQPPVFGSAAVQGDTGEPAARIELGLDSSRADVLLWLVMDAA